MTGFAGDGGKLRRVLVVEDDPTMAEMLQLLLEDSGCTILRAATGEQALQLARDEACDLLTLDLGLPGMDGRAVLRLLKSDPATADLPVIVVTGMRFVPSPEERIAAVLEKPFDASELEEAVLTALGLPRGRNTARNSDALQS